MFEVHTEFGPVAAFDTRDEADAFAERENADDPGAYWVLYVRTLGGSGYPRG